MIKRWIITTILMCGLALASFGQHGVASESQTQAAAYVLAGGSWADLCGDGTNPLANSSKCLACVISENCALPAQENSGRHGTEPRVRQWITTGQTAHPARLQSAQTARAPPFI